MGIIFRQLPLTHTNLSVLVLTAAIDPSDPIGIDFMAASVDPYEAIGIIYRHLPLTHANV
jgi:hypothetical protein